MSEEVVKNKILVRSYAEIATTDAGVADILELDNYEVNSSFGGGTFERVKSGVLIPGYRVRTKDGVLFQRVYPEGEKPVLRLEDFGWTPAFNGDCRVMLETGMKAAAAAQISFELPKPAAIIRVSGWVTFPSNIPEINGNDCTLYFYYVDRPDGGFWSPDKERATGITIRNLHMDFDRVDTRLTRIVGFWFKDPENCTVENCRINSRENHTLIMRTTIPATKPSRNNRLRNLELYVQKEIDNEARINLLIDVEGGVLMDNVWLETKSVVDRIGHEDYVIENCRFINGRYGIGGNYAKNFRINNITCVKNIRGSSFQNKCSNLTFRDMKIYESKSSAFHMGYDVRNVQVYGLTAKTNRGEGQGLIHGNVGVYDCRFENAYLENTNPIASGGQQWIIYFGVNASRNTVRNVSIYGKAKYTTIAIESDWVDGVNYGVSLKAAGNKIDVVGGIYATEPSVGNVIENVDITALPVTPQSPAVQLVAGAYDLVGTTIRNVNVLNEVPTQDFSLYAKSTGKVTEVVLENNGFRDAKSDYGPVASYDSLIRRKVVKPAVTK